MRSTLRVLVTVFAVALSLATAAPASAAAPAVVGGGSGVVVSNAAGPKNFCTITTIGRDDAGRLVGLTAGHCAVPGDTVSAENFADVGPIGTVAATNTDYDYAVIEFDASKVLPVNRIGDTVIDSLGGPAQFPATVCKEGRSTGRTCGLTYGDVLNTQQTFTQVCTNDGDSGAPVVQGGTLVAMVNSFLVVPCLGPEVGTSIGSVFREIDASGGVGTGFVPVR